VEDQLQAEVGDVIEQFKFSGTRINMLTGDKVQTAINVARSCKIINVSTALYKLLDVDKAVL